MTTDYNGYQHTVYAQGRALTPEAAQAWAEAFRRWAPADTTTVLDLGSGTGRFTPILAEACKPCQVYGVEPSHGMRTAAERDATHPAVRYLDGSATAIPLPDGSCDLVLLFLVLQHVTDRPAAAAEIRRVLRPGGRLLVRSTFADRLPDLTWHRYFPGARAVERRMFPTLQETMDLFELPVVGLDKVRERLAPGLRAYAARLELRAISVFEHLTDAEIEAGFAALRTAAAAETVPVPIEEDSDLLVLQLDPPGPDPARQRPDWW
ncbi:methyltransferase domain-containing protein [Dactylosporangium sp. NBC_01737]|uniref:class I SAM-dependent methyltransferase n=1 Tax=Dactylosporangium sp. NBC_01737 TaxID=2975959 RepID=UPI002E1299D0|nr:methyltransferase domain-containing protein [Dactylosporangium sp. NBC_01737]